VPGRVFVVGFRCALPDKYLSDASTHRMVVHVLIGPWDSGLVCILGQAVAHERRLLVLRHAYRVRVPTQMRSHESGTAAAVPDD
jgi:hypothetical protein